MRALVACSLVSSLFLACASSVEGPTGGNGGDGGGPAGAGGSTGSDCPSTPPVLGTRCTPPWTSNSFESPSAHCSWGDDPRPPCRTTAVCETDGTWRVTSPGAACGEPALPSACPSPPPTAGSACADDTLACWYDDGDRCWCSECRGGTGYPVCQPIDPPAWACAVPGEGCPAKMPQAGSACDTPGASCGPDCELVITCEGGVWQWRKGSCPICAAPNTPIATPSGDRPIASLGIGDLVYSVDGDAIVAVPIVRAGHTPVHAHRVVRVELDSGAVLEISPGHPTADGRTFGELRAGSLLDEAHAVVQARLVPYAYVATYDILPDSSTGAYFAAGALVSSTLRQ